MFILHFECGFALSFLSGGWFAMQYCPAAMDKWLNSIYKIADLVDYNHKAIILQIVKDGH